jgi:hypothetical protein
VIDPSGVYQVAGLRIEVIPDGHDWKLVFGGVPGGFEPGLVRLDDSSFKVERGPFHDAVFVFDSPAGGRAGMIPFVRAEGKYEVEPGQGLAPPPLNADPKRDESFAELLAAAAPGARVEWGLSYPKHEFVRWAQSLDRFVFHSSNNVGIAEFLPVRNSIELQDHSGRGNLGAVYATHDGYWSMFFAVVDRERIRGSIRNGVSYWEAPDGRTATTYNFSVEQGSLSGRPFTRGAIYLLPRDTFHRLPFYPDGPMSNEWASQEPVRPFASLLVEPDDFPFLDRIAGHEEPEFLSMLDLFGEVIGTAIAYRHDEDLRIEIEWSESNQAGFAEWTGLARRYIPDVNFSLEGDGDLRRLVLQGPDAYLNAVQERLDSILGPTAS